MKKNMQTFINICFFISIIVLIYQTDRKQDKIDLTKFDQIELKLRDIEKINNLQGETFESWQSLLNKKSSELGSIVSLIPGIGTVSNGWPLFANPGLS